MTYPNLNTETAMRLAALVAAIGIVWDALELTLRSGDLLDKFFEWRVVRTRYYILIRHQALGAVFDILLSGRIFKTLVILHGIAAPAFCLVLPLSHRLAAVLAAIVLIGHLAVHVRLLVGMDGADQMQTVLWAGLLVYSLDLGRVGVVSAAAFVCAELVLSYVVSGTAKLVSPVWRAGTAIARITRTATYCPPGVSRALQSRLVSSAVCWSVMSFELLGPVALFWGRPGAVVFMAIGVAFHVGIALTMGLTTFVFAFLAAYPILYSSIAR